MTDSASERERVACFDCGAPYDSPTWIEAVVPNDVWEKISPTKGEGGILCITCMAVRCIRLGLVDVPTKLTAGPLLSDLAFARAGLAAEKAVPISHARSSGILAGAQRVAFLARVYLDGSDLASELLRRHLARTYLPGRDGGWC